MGHHVTLVLDLFLDLHDKDLWAGLYNHNLSQLVELHTCYNEIVVRRQVYTWDMAMLLKDDVLRIVT